MLLLLWQSHLRQSAAFTTPNGRALHGYASAMMICSHPTIVSYHAFRYPHLATFYYRAIISCLLVLFDQDRRL
jgi:hypothetical protein